MQFSQPGKREAGLKPGGGRAEGKWVDLRDVQGMKSTGLWELSYEW